MLKSALISIIVPVYNTEKYLFQCLDSLICQTYTNIEIIVVNDGSTDCSTKVINEFKNKDARIILSEQPNKGVSEARNHGLNVANGDLIMFVDSDDWIDLNTCEQTFEAFQKFNTDIVLFSYFREFRKGVKKSRYILPKKKIFNEEESVDLRRRLFGLIDKELSDPSQADILGTVFSKLYRANIIKENKLEFIDLKIIGSAEDILFNINYFKYVTSAFYIHNCFYHLRKYNETSITTNYRNQLECKWRTLFERMNKVIEIENLSSNYKIALNNRIALSIFGLGLNILSSDFSTNRKIYEIKKIISSSQYIQAYSKLSFRYFPLHWRVFFSFAKNQNGTGVYFLLKIIQKIIKR